MIPTPHRYVEPGWGCGMPSHDIPLCPSQKHDGVHPGNFKVRVFGTFKFREELVEFRGCDAHNGIGTSIIDEKSVFEHNGPARINDTRLKALVLVPIVRLKDWAIGPGGSTFPGFSRSRSIAPALYSLASLSSTTVIDEKPPVLSLESAAHLPRSSCCPTYWGEPFISCFVFNQVVRQN